MFSKFLKSRRVQAFVAKAVWNPADCQIEISEIAGWCDAFIRGLVEWRVTYIKLTRFGEEVNFPEFKADAIRALETKLLGVCPECHIVTNGEQLIRIYKIVDEMRTKAGPFFVAEELSSGVERFLEGKCRNSNCDCKEILIFWRPHEDKKATNRLAKMEIKI